MQNFSDDDRFFMQQAIQQAEAADRLGEVPVGAVIVCDGQIVSAAYNTRETNKNAMMHAECKAIDLACRNLGGWRLHRCTLYVTLEPCPMCAGAIVNARILRVCFGAFDPKAGAFGSVIDLNSFSLNHKPVVCGGLLEKPCRALLQSFFKGLRQRATGLRSVSPPISPFKIIAYEDQYRDDMIFMILEAKNALGRIPGLNQDLLDIQTNYFDRGGMFWIALDERNRVIGSIGFRTNEKPNEVTLHRLFVKYNLKHRGIGTALLQKAEEYISSIGKEKVYIHLGTGQEWFESKAFYKKHRYTEYMPDKMMKILRNSRDS